MTPTTDQTYDAIDAFDRAHMSAVELVKHLKKERPIVARELSAALRQMLKHQATIVEVVMSSPVDVEPAQPARVLQLMPPSDRT